MERLEAEEAERVWREAEEKAEMERLEAEEAERVRREAEEKAEIERLEANEAGRARYIASENFIKADNDLRVANYSEYLERLDAEEAERFSSE